jgi:hypothetical protein
MKKWTKEEIQTLLNTNPSAVVRGILAIYEYQTAHEKAAHLTEEHNGVGFNALDAEILTSLAKQILSWQGERPAERKYNFPLSVKQLELAKKKMKKYAGQLAKIANRKEEMKQAA